MPAFPHPLHASSRSEGHVNLYGLEITERKREAEKLRRANRMLRALTHGNQALLHAGDEAEYLKEVCRIIIEDCGHAMVWVGYAEDDQGKTVRPVAHAGFEDGYLETLNVTWADTERGCGPTGRAIRIGQVQTCRDMHNDPQFRPWREEAIRRGYASSISLPLAGDGKVFGALMIYSRDADDFSQDEVKMLTELANDFAFGITSLRLRAAHTRAEESLRESEQRFRRKLDSILSPEGNIGSLDLADMIDVPAVQSLMDDFYELAHIPMSIIDLDGKVLLGVGWQDVCMNFHRVHPETRRHCTESDTQLAAGLEPGESRLYKCKNNMWDIATPIMVGGQHVGNLFSGQFFFEGEKPDRELFEAQARQYGFKQDKYLAAIEAVPHLSRQSVATGMSFFTKLARLLSQLSYSNIKLARSLAEREALLVSAEAANQAKSQFLAHMSHELRTPMNAILGLMDVALPKATDPTVRDCLQTARESADLLLTLVNDLLDSAKVESGKLALEAAPFSLRGMFGQMSRVLSVRASEKGLSFYCGVSDETPDAVVGDRMRLQQVLLNLGSNAIKFTEKGEVAVDLHRSALGDVGEEDVTLEFSVRDTGIGIPSCALERLFQPFAQADASMARRFGGSGLGLSISQRLVEMMGGRILVQTEVGNGSRFTFTVRLRLAKELPPDCEALAAIPATARVPLRVLLVEDNPANQKLANYILRERGHTVEIAEDGREAVLFTERTCYDLLLMDVQMPGMDGLEATTIIRQREAGGRRVPIIAMTAHAMKGDRDRCMAAGMDGYLCKPVNAPEMISLVESLADGTRSQDAPGDSPKLATDVSPVPVAGNTPAASLGPTGVVDQVFNRQQALSLCCDDPEMVQEMIQCFDDEVKNLFPQMRAALQKGDLVEVGRLGHRMKGTVVYLGAEPTRQAALRVERFCKSSGGAPSEAQAAVDVLEHECARLMEAVSQERSVPEAEHS